MGMRNKTQPTSQYPSYPIVHTKYAQKMKHHKTVNLYTVKTCENHGFPIVFLLSFCKKNPFQQPSLFGRERQVQGDEDLGQDFRPPQWISSPQL